MRFLTGFVGAVSEAWAELRIHRTRVMLSLIGVGVAVTAITTVVGLGGMVQQSTTESMERSSGRPATLMISAFNPQTGEQASGDSLREAFDAVVERYQISHAGANRWATLYAQFSDGVAPVETQGVDVAFGTMHRVRVSDGAWFSDYDEQRLAPALVVNELFYERIGSPDLRTHPTISLVGDSAGTAVIIGVMPAEPWETSPRSFILNTAFERISSAAAIAGAAPSFELWVPPELADELTSLIQRDTAGALGEGFQVDVSRNDYAAYNSMDPLLPLRLLVGGVAGLVLLLGALGLVNISLVTVRQRIREIGIRRSFGATAGRVFFSVMMESVVASFAAGVIGVIIAILIVRNPWVQEQLAQGIMDVPPFPIEAALLGLGAATAVGALAGLLPALVAVRVKVIDAIRF
ncbi:putative ABC transport system permease protein [Homoserinimonas aerilata]|uniref:Putative ABC transport system permease protein n=1 Tax=Homoserinimonas aerilata TaxID=1162970 RepID=A0A542YJU0_9MICO|nr:ABC transporter permease [Homoserinimonas aerilata]TQL48376.1 putative ABC transport system permease protein [Homoserinimonas aerilata]